MANMADTEKLGQDEVEEKSPTDTTSGDDELEGQPPTPVAATPYTVFTSRQKLLLSILLGFSMLTSPFTATVYMPVIPLLSKHFHTSIQAINLTITVYFIFQALSPAIFATISDSQGRRIIFISTYAIYVLASLGLALNKSSYAALIVLRAFQALGASAIIPMAYGIIADVCVPSERGRMLGPLMIATNLGVCIGPVVGGLLGALPNGSQLVFIFLLAFGVITFLAIAFFFPETARNIVGNGSITPSGWRRTWWSLLKEWVVKIRHLSSDKQVEDDKPRSTEIIEKRKWDWKAMNPFACLRILFYRDTALTVWMTASFYAIYFVIQTSIPNIYQDIYGFSQIETGLAFLPGGFGVVLAGPANGWLMDWNYRRTARDIGHKINKVGGDDMLVFPIERARSRSSLHLLVVYIACLTGYGWAVQVHAHPAVPLVIQFLIGFVFTFFNQCYSTLLVDIFPESPSTASATGAIMRCGLSALALACMNPLIKALGYGWYFTLLTGLSGVAGVAAVILIRTKGMKWRLRRLKQAEEKQSRKMNNNS